MKIKYTPGISISQNRSIRKQMEVLNDCCNCPAVETLLYQRTPQQSPIVKQAGELRKKYNKDRKLRKIP